MIEPELVVDIKRIPSMQARHQDRVQAFASAGRCRAPRSASNAVLKKAWPGVVEAANVIGSDQIQGRLSTIVWYHLHMPSPAADSVPVDVWPRGESQRGRPERQADHRCRRRRHGSRQTSLKKGEVGSRPSRCRSPHRNPATPFCGSYPARKW
jgi:carbon-monoxide dehydrogenase medium subunit